MESDILPPRRPTCTIGRHERPARGWQLLRRIRQRRAYAAYERTIAAAQARRDAR